MIRSRLVHLFQFRSGGSLFRSLLFVGLFIFGELFILFRGLAAAFFNVQHRIMRRVVRAAPLMPLRVYD